MPPVARRERIFDGHLTGPGHDDLDGEVWSNGEVAIIFRLPWRTQVATIRGPVFAMNTDAKLTVTGTDDTTGDTVTWTALSPERMVLDWRKATVRLPDGPTLTDATVQVTNFRVTVLKAGDEPREFVAATVRQASGGNIVTTIDGQEILVTVKKGCGCGR